MGEKEWAMHNEWLRKEELERYRLSVPTPTTSTTVSKVPRVLDGKQEPSLFGVSGMGVVVSEGKPLVGTERAPAAAE